MISYILQFMLFSVSLCRHLRWNFNFVPGNSVFDPVEYKFVLPLAQGNIIFRLCVSVFVCVCVCSCVCGGIFVRTLSVVTTLSFNFQPRSKRLPDPFKRLPPPTPFEERSSSVPTYFQLLSAASTSKKTARPETSISSAVRRFQLHSTRSVRKDFQLFVRIDFDDGPGPEA